MAVTTITIKDDDAGGCSMSISCDTEIPENDDECTPAMVTGAMVMRLMDSIRLQAEAEVAAEGKGE